MQALPGFRDFLPDDCAERNYIFARWRDVARRCGLLNGTVPFSSPPSCTKKRAAQKSSSNFFNFTEKGEREDRMRPELTPTLARMSPRTEREFKKHAQMFSDANVSVTKTTARRFAQHFNSIATLLGSDPCRDHRVEWRRHRHPRDVCSPKKLCQSGSATAIS
jgi:histidyl-tRNA synthetase